jgi:hypothetical protein
MDRIRRYKDNFQVLITPNQKYNVGFEYVIGSWSDESLKGFSVIEVDALDKAVNLANNHPNINWDQLVEFHKDSFLYLEGLIKKIIKYSQINVEINSHLMEPNETKNVLMNRVLKYQDNGSFRLVNNMNDIISFEISSKSSINLEKLITHLIKNSNLKIFKSYEKNKVIHLIGRTDISTTYEIILVPTLIKDWLSMKNNSLMSYDNTISSFKEILTIQNKIDSMYI